MKKYLTRYNGELRRAHNGEKWYRSQARDHKAYICISVSFTLKAVQLEAVSELTQAVFITCLRRFSAQRGKPTTIWSNHNKNLMGATKEL